MVELHPPSSNTWTDLFMVSSAVSIASSWRRRALTHLSFSVPVGMAEVLCHTCRLYFNDLAPRMRNTAGMHTIQERVREVRSVPRGVEGLGIAQRHPLHRMVVVGYEEITSRRQSSIGDM
jgi:hypothetical protein